MKDYLYDNYGLLWRAIVVSLVFTILPFYRFKLLSLGQNALCFIVAFVVYCAVDVLFEWGKVRKANKENQ